MIETVLVAAVVLGIAVVIGAVAAPQGVPYFSRKGGGVADAMSDHTATCLTASTRWCWCVENDFPEEDPSGTSVLEWDRNTEEKTMNRGALAASVLTAAIGLAASAATGPVSAAEMTKEQMMQMMQQTQEKMATEHLEQCYGVNAAGRNDCGGGVHSCSGQATQARDPQSFILVPAGVCSKIADGSPKPA